MACKTKECECSGCECLDKHLLAVIQPKDKEHPLVKAFLESLPKGTKVKLDSRGSLGRRDADYFLLSARDFSGVNKEYFRNLLNGSAAFEIDYLNFSVHFKQKDRKYKGDLGEHMSGGIDDILDQYERWSNVSPESLFTFKLHSLVDECAREEAAGLPIEAQTAMIMKGQFFKKGLLSGETKLAVPTNITIHLTYGSGMTLQEKDLGTYVDALNNLRRKD